MAHAATTGEKKVKGRKRHFVVDTQGHLLRVSVHVADLHDSVGAECGLAELTPFLGRLVKLWADSAYRPIVEWVKAAFGIELDIVTQAKDHKGFVVLPRRWVVERTIGWLNRNRRLSKEYESHPECSAAWIYLASIRLLTLRLADGAS